MLQLLVLRAETLEVILANRGVLLGQLDVVAVLLQVVHEMVRWDLAAQLERAHSHKRPGRDKHDFGVPRRARDAAGAQGEGDRVRLGEKGGDTARQDVLLAVPFIVQLSAVNSIVRVIVVVLFNRHS